jgi:hypothetical protein
VHLNPVRAKLLKPQESLLAYPWSSFGWYLAARIPRPGWGRVDRVLGEHGLYGQTETRRAEFERRMEANRAEKADPAALAPCTEAGAWAATRSGSNSWSG